jgi:hypothetical protein
MSTWARGWCDFVNEPCPDKADSGSEFPVQQGVILQPANEEDARPN